ncbi:MAG: hypothetical protein ACE3JK_03295 [Sporolactobacillus sp.]
MRKNDRAFHVSGVLPLRIYS